MGTCKYCGKNAGWFSHSHKECRAKHDQGVIDFGAVVSSYFAGRVTTYEVQRQKNRLTIDAFLNEEDICNVSETAIRQYAASIHRPFAPSCMKPVEDYINAIGISYNSINSKGGVDEFSAKIMKSFMVDYFTDQLTLQTAHQRCEKVLAKFPMSLANIEETYLYVLNKAATKFMQNGTLSDDDQLKLETYIHYLHLPINNLPAKYEDSEIAKIGQMSIIKSLQRGVVPPSNFSAPIMLGRGESIIWVYNGVSMYQEKTVKEYSGRRSGFSFRIMKGVTYHTGGSRIQPIEHTYMDNKGVGTLYITNKNIIFKGDTTAQKVAYTKMIGVTPYSDGIEVHRDGANAKRLAFQGFDSWFFMNVISAIANL